MMFMWIPFLLIPLIIFWAFRPEMAHGCGMGHAMYAAPAAPGSVEPLEIARQRLARGEITVAQFEEIKSALAR